MPHALLIALDLVAITVLTFGLYFPRHRRRDLVVAYLCVNVGVLAVADVLSTSTIGVGLGLGLFGVLSIIRLRSYEISQHEVAYYFAALAMGLLAGMGVDGWTTAGLIVLLVVVMFVGDHPKLLRRYREQTVTLDRAITDEATVTTELERLLGGTVHHVHVREVDLVNDTTLVDVRFQVGERRAQPAAPAAPTSALAVGTPAVRS